MLPILLMVLKIIGIVILALLGLAFAVLVLVLVVPVRYGLSGSYYGKVQGTGKVTWLFHALSLKVTYEDGLDVTVRVLGKRVFQKKEGKAEVREEVKDGLEEVRKASQLAGQELTVDFVETAGEDAGPRMGGTADSHGQGGSKESGAFAGDGRDQEDDKDGSGKEGIEAPGNSPEKGAGSLKEKKKCRGWNRGKNKDKGRKGKGKGKRTDPDSAGSGLKEKLVKLKESVEGTWIRLEGYKDKAVSFWNDEGNQKAVRVVLRQVKAVLCHILPRKVRGKAVFGFDNPATTGKVLSVLSVAYVWYGDRLEVIPVFDRSILEVEGNLKGRVQAGVIVARGVRVLLNKNFRRLAWSLLKNGGK